MRKFLTVFEKFLIVFFLLFSVLSLRPAYISHAYPVRYTELVKRYAEENSFSPAFIFAVIYAESGFNANAVSKKGAVGLMQIMPQTAGFIAGRNGYDYLESYLTNPEYNIRTGCRYLSYLRARFLDESTLLAAYNAGEGNVGEWLKNPKYSVDGKILSKIPYPETQNYVQKVQKLKNKYEKHYRFS
ncbi:MAG: lytic transglycosylase domain-containing protein [Clostridiales bacterium]|nr:lytic transglycosylase domain-containing protein [Clostridiales bacterium]